jgi:hypothetical protein
MMKKINYLILISLFSVSQSLAQYGSIGVTDARSMGLGKSYNACSRGVYSLGINPSNLVYGKNMSLDFATLLPLPQVSLKSGSDFMSWEDFNYYFGGVNGEGRQLTENDKKALNNLFKDGGTFFVYGTTHLFSATYKVNPLIGAFGLSITDYASSSITIPHALVDLAMTGNPSGYTFDFNDGQAKMWWLRNYSLSYAREIPFNFFRKFAAGISFKLIHGYTYVGTEKNDTYFSTDSRAAISGEADLKAQTAFSDNFGVKYDFDPYPKRSRFNIFPLSGGLRFRL